MTKGLLLLIFTAVCFIFMAASARADTPISACGYNITAAGNYYLTNDIDTSGIQTQCIYINASNVNINLGGFSITQNNAYPYPTDYGIYVTAPSGLLIENVTVTNGVIKQFMGSTKAYEQIAIYLNKVNGFTISNMNLVNNQIGISYLGIYDIDIQYASPPTVRRVGYISNNIFNSSRSVGIALGAYTWRYGSGIQTWDDVFSGNYYFHTSNLNISSNSFINTAANRDIWGFTNSSTFSQNTAGNMVVNDCCYLETFYLFGIPQTAMTCISPCSGTASGSGQSINLRWGSYGNRFIQNVLYSTGYKINMESSIRNLYLYNQLLTFGSGSQGIFFDATSNDNYGCGNLGSITDLGSNNLWETTCNTTYTGGVTCTAGYFCSGNDNLTYVATDCHSVNTTNCPSIIGSTLPKCVSNGATSYCRSATPVTAITTTTLPNQGVNGSYLQPVFPINATEWTTAGYAWLLPFFSVFFLSTMFLIVMVAGAAMIGGPTGGGVAALGLLIVYSVLGIYPIWIAILIGLGGAAIVAKLVLGVAQK